MTRYDWNDAPKWANLRAVNRDGQAIYVRGVVLPGEWLGHLNSEKGEYDATDWENSAEYRTLYKGMHDVLRVRK